MSNRYKYNNKNRNSAGNPIHQPTESYKKGWDRIFGKKKMKKETKYPNKRLFILNGRSTLEFPRGKWRGDYRANVQL